MTVYPRILSIILALSVSARACVAAPPPEPTARHWRAFTTADGLPDNRVRAIHIAGKRLWIGTDDGLALGEGAAWKSWTTDDGLPAPVVTAIDTDPVTGDLWLGTLGGGLARFSGGRFDSFNQLNSGIAGNLVFDVAVTRGRVWSATNGGISAFDISANLWHLFAERRADEPDTAVAGFAPLGDDLYAAVWCGDILRLPPSADPDTPHSLFAIRQSDSLATTAIASSADTLWFASLTHLHRIGPGGVRSRVPVCDRQVSHRDIRALAAAPDGRVFVGDDYGLHELLDWDANQWITRTASPAGPFARAARSVFGGTKGGGRDGRTHGRRDEGALDSAVDDSDSSADRVRAIAIDGPDLWVATQAGLMLGTIRPPSIPWSRCPSVPSSHGPSVPSSPIAIAVIGPTTRTLSLPGEKRLPVALQHRPDLLAVQLAVEQANARGGFRRQIPFELASVSDDYVFANYGWGSFEDEILVYAREPEVVGIIAHIAPDRRATTLAIRQAEIPVINVAPTAPSVDESINRWVFRPIPSSDAADPRLHEFITTYTRRNHVGRSKQPPTARALNSYRAARCLIDAINAVESHELESVGRRRAIRKALDPR